MASKENLENSLERSLLPLWFLSYHGYLLFDWCKEFPGKSRLTIIAHCVGIFFCITAMLMECGYETYQLWQEIFKTNSTIVSIMPNLLWVSNFPPGLITALFFLIKRNDFLSFFKDWKELENRMICHPKTPLNRLRVWVYGGIALAMTASSVALIGMVLNRLDASYLLSFYPIIREKLTIWGVALFHFIPLCWAFGFVVLADLVPAWTFYHGGLILGSLTLEIEKIFKNLPESGISNNIASNFEEIRLKYESASELMKRANRLFGWITVVNHGVTFFIICAELYNVFNTVHKGDWDTWSSFVFLSVYVARLAISILMAAQLEASSDMMRLALSIVLTSNISRNTAIGADDNKKWEMFLFRLRESPLVARPLGLYQLTPSLLLTATNLIITYVFVLLQSNCIAG